jgi:thiamine pyrophosphokinase
MSRAVVFANGDIADLEFVRRWLLPDDFIIAADGGLRHIMQISLSPHVVVGDLDSAPNELLQLAERRGAEIIRHQARKDKTDLELALDLARDRRIEETIVFGALGGRPDHALANILLLSAVGEHSVRMIDAGYEVFVMDDRADIAGDTGDLVTLLALTREATGISTSGLEYPLIDGVLARGSSRGVSNVMIADSASITIGHGELIVVHVLGGIIDTVAGPRP